MADQEYPVTFEPGEWEGEYIDAYGYRGTLRLSIASDGEKLSGKYELTVRSEDQPQTFGGAVQGSVARSATGSDRVQMQLNLGPEGKGDAQTITYDAVVRPAGTFAKQALFGMVESAPTSDIAQANFGGGVWVAWLFDKSAK